MRVLITGGAGFIGVNAARHYLTRGDDVCVVDNLYRRGADHNIKRLQADHARVRFDRISILDFAALRRVVENFKPQLVLHLAGQTAVTTSVLDPREDFDLNALGTLNVLEALRTTETIVPLIFASTNKVYGQLDHLRVVEKDKRYAYAPPLEAVNEQTPLDFHSPYGCSKGSGDSYVRDYHRIYGLPTVVMRQSCIYGEHQFGIEDQGWIAWFTIAAELQRPVTIYGNGKQVRDVLFVDDLVAAYDAAYEKIAQVAGRTYNIGGGPSNSSSLLEFLELLAEIRESKLDFGYSDWRPGDQYIYISDIAAARKDLGWEPRIRFRDGLQRLVGWVRANRTEVQRALSK